MSASKALRMCLAIFQALNNTTVIALYEDELEKIHDKKTEEGDKLPKSLPLKQLCIYGKI